jgi:glucokinase
MIENRTDVNMILAGDLGGTKSLLGLFDAGRMRPEPIVVRSFSTTEFDDLTAMISTFSESPEVHGQSVTAACFGVAGPVLGTTASLTNVPFVIDGDAVAKAFAIERVVLLNDLEAMAYSVTVLGDDEVAVLHEGQSQRGNMALIAAGTGINEAFIHRLGDRLVPAAAESGHADWAARNNREIRVLRHLLDRYGRAEVEHVVSGLGLLNVHEAMHEDIACPAIDSTDEPDAAAKISEAAIDRRCRGCIDTLEVFVDAYGAEAGNLALRTMALGGLYIGGGIAPKLLPLLTDGRFMRAFLDKGRFGELLRQVPVKVILNAESALLGAAVAASAAG